MTTVVAENQGEEVLTPEQVAPIFNVHRATVCRWIREGRFPGATRVGVGGPRDHYLIPRSAVEALRARFVRPAV